MLRPSEKSVGASSTKRVARLQRELQETQQKLNGLEKKKNASMVSQKSKRNKPELADWFGSKSEGIEVLKGSSVSEATVNHTTATVSRSEMAEAIDRESAPISFEGIDMEKQKADESQDSGSGASIPCFCVHRRRNQGAGQGGNSHVEVQCWR